MENTIPVTGNFSHFEFHGIEDGSLIAMKLVPVFIPAKKVPLGIVTDANTRKMYVIALVKENKKGKIILEELIVPPSEVQVDSELTNS